MSENIWTVLPDNIPEKLKEVPPELLDKFTRWVRSVYGTLQGHFEREVRLALVSWANVDDHRRFYEYNVDKYPGYSETAHALNHWIELQSWYVDRNLEL